MKQAKQTKRTIGATVNTNKWMKLRAHHARMSRSVLQLIANADASKSDILAAAEIFREATDLIEAEYTKLCTRSHSTYLPVLEYRRHSIRSPKAAK